MHSQSAEMPLSTDLLEHVLQLSQAVPLQCLPSVHLATYKLLLCIAMKHVKEAGCIQLRGERLACPRPVSNAAAV